MSRVTGRHTRPKKLTPKQNVPIFREEQVDSASAEAEALRHQIDTGVEKSEESEYHLQQAIKASQTAKSEKLKDAHIPTPPTISSDIQYDVLYPKGWQQPNTYIRSSATVEDCNPISYCMDEEDEIALKQINAKAGQSSVSEDQFEEVMTFFEETVSIEQPFASVHNAPVMSLDELLRYVSDSTPVAVGIFGKIVYDHWSTRRASKDNHAVPPQLKFESGQESDDSDPYVCFRRREIRQTRKTRHRDLQSAEKLRKLRIELESARSVLLMVKQREQGRFDQLQTDKDVFIKRQEFREVKRKLKQPGDDDLLITQKKPKLPPVVPPNEQLPQQIVSRPVQDLKTIEDLRADRARAIETEIQLNVEKHIRWNDGYVDKTTYPLSPSPDRFREDTQFIPAMPAEYLPTPPASVSEDEAEMVEKDVEMKDVSRSSTPFRYASPTEDDDDDRPPMPQFRRRIGRGGRVVMDRKFPIRTRRTDDDRFKFDRDSDDEENDPYDDSFIAQSTRQSNERSLLMARSILDSQTASARRAQAEQANAGHTPVQPQPQPQPGVAGGSS